MLDAGCSILGMLDAGCSMLDARCWMLGGEINYFRRVQDTDSANTVCILSNISHWSEHFGKDF